MAENTIKIFGLTFDLDPVAFSIPGLNITVYWYGIILTVGILLALTYALVNCKRFDIKTDPLIDVTLISTIGAIVGARLYFVLFYDFKYYFANPQKIFALWEGGLAIYGGLIGAFVTGYFMAKWKKIKPAKLFDLASIGFLIGQAVGRWGNFVNQEAFGSNTRLPWAMWGGRIRDELLRRNTEAGERIYSTNVGVHPTFLYESLWCIIGFILLHYISKKRKKFDGQIFLMYIGWYGLGRFFIEGLRVDSLMLDIPFLFSIRVSQVVAAVCVILSVTLLVYFMRKAKEEGALTVETGEAFTEVEAEDEIRQESVVSENSDTSDKEDTEEAADSDEGAEGDTTNGDEEETEKETDNGEDN